MRPAGRLLGLIAGLCVAAGCGTTSSPGGSGSGGGTPDAGSTGGGLPDAGATGGGGTPDAGSAGGGGTPDAGSSGGGTDGGTAANDCDGLAPSALPKMVQYQTQVDVSMPHGFCELPVGDGNGLIAQKVSNMGHPTWTILTPSGEVHGSFGFWHGEAWATPGGFIGYGGSSTQQMVVVDGFDERGAVIGHTEANGSAVFAPDPRGGLFAVGHFNPGSAPTKPPADTIVQMFKADGSTRWGPSPSPTNAAVFGAGVDLLGRAVVIVDGGSGNIDAIWFDERGTATTKQFRIISGFQAGVSTWFETSPLIGGDLALRRMDQPGTGEHRTSQWLGVLQAGTESMQSAPDWLTSRPNTNLQLARSGRAYAFSPWAEDVASCEQQVEVVSPSGSSCGKADFPVDGNACTTRELRVGLDGTVMQMLPISREQNQPPGSAVYTCTLRFWPGVLR